MYEALNVFNVFIRHTKIPQNNRKKTKIGRWRYDTNRGSSSSSSSSVEDLNSVCCCFFFFFLFLLFFVFNIKRKKNIVVPHIILSFLDSFTSVVYYFIIYLVFICPLYIIRHWHVFPKFFFHFPCRIVYCVVCIVYAFPFSRLCDYIHQKIYIRFWERKKKKKSV